LQIQLAHRGRVAVVTLHRPAEGNRITQAMAEQIIQALTDARKDRAVAGVVLTGEGDTFCLGGDYAGAGPTTAGRMEFGRAHIDLIDAMARLGKPLIAAVNGNAHAGGFALVAACDMAFAAPSATLGLPEAAHGLFPFLATAIVHDALPKKVFFDIVYNAKLLTAAEASRLHLVNDIVPQADLLATAIRAVERAAAANPDVLMLGRDLYYAAQRRAGASMDEARFALGAALGARDGT